MDLEIKDKVIVITGGTRGIGRSTAQLLAQEGAIVFACGRHSTDFDNENIHYHPLDVTDYSQCVNLRNEVLKAYSRIDGLVADAGITADALTQKMTEEDFIKVINTNLLGVFNIVKAIGPTMQVQKHGSIVTVSSVVGEYGNIGQANYAASKAGVIAMTKSWAKEFSRKGEGVRVNSVAPGYILTDMLKSVPEELLQKFEGMTMLKRLGQPEEIADTIAFLLSDRASYITGAVIDANGGMRL